MPKISALVMTLNEQEMIEGCLKQLDFAQEIIVLDQGSTDSTIKIASKYTAKIYKTQSDDFSSNRNKLASHATGDWLLYVDADERLGRELTREIQARIVNSKVSAYKIARKNFILGKWQKHGGWWPDYVPRLIRRDKLIKWQGEVHESPQIEGQFGRLKNPIEHLTARTVKMMLQKSTKWASVEAQLFYKSQNPKVTIAKVLKASTWEFIRRYFAKFGFLDGKVGFIAALYQAIHQAMVQAYLWELQNNTRQRFQKIKNSQ